MKAVPMKGLPRGADQHCQQVGRELGLIKKPRPAVRRRHSRGLDRDHFDEARRTTVRGSDQDQARQHRGSLFRPAGGQLAARRLVRAEPGRGEVDHPRGQAAAIARIAARKARDAARDRKGCWAAAGCRAACGLPVDRSRRMRDLRRRRGLGRRIGQGGQDPVQAILPIRGKILNVEKAIDRSRCRTRSAGDHFSARDRVHEDFDIAKLRYHKIILMADADVDGAHIRTCC